MITNPPCHNLSSFKRHLWSTIASVLLGVHPNVVGQQGGLSNEEWARLESPLDRKEVVGLGEVGLDYKKTTNLRGELEQRRFLRHVADLARERKLPMVLHLRG